MEHKSRLIIGALSLGTLLLGIFAWIQLSRPNTEPVFNGRPLGFWLEALETWTNSAQLQVARNNADAALQSSGTNAIPTLLRWLAAHDSRVAFKLRNLMAKVSPYGSFRRTALLQHQLANDGFNILGARASNAVPALINIIEHAPDLHSRVTAIWAIGYIGPPATNAIPALLHSATKEFSDMRMYSFQSLGRIQAETGSVLPALIKGLDDPVQGVRYQAVLAINNLPVEPAQANAVVPAMVKVLQDPQLFGVTRYACFTLAAYGTNSQAALPPLFQFLRSRPPNATSPEFLQIIVNTIRAIDPETARQNEEELDAILQKSPTRPRP